MRCRTRNPPSCHQPCVSPVSSRSFAGSLKKIWQETANTSGSRNPSSNGARKSGATRMSLLSSTTIAFFAARNPALLPPPKPRLVGNASTRTPGNRSRRNSALPSVDPLSTTMISFSGLPARASITDGRYFSSRSRPFQLGMTTVAVVGRASGPPCTGRAGDPPHFPNRSLSASTTKLIAIRNGEINSSGSDRRTRFNSSMSERRPHAHLAAELHPARGPHHREQRFQLALLFVELARPGRPRFQLPLRLFQRGDSLRRLIALQPDLRGETRLRVD